MKSARAWLAMAGPASDEATYKQNIDLVDTVTPIRGKLNANGTWTEYDGAVYSSFAQELPALAQSHCQQYCPAFNSGHGNNWDALLAVLNHEELWQAAVQRLVSLATETAFDAGTWDGIVYDAVSGDAPFNHLHGQFIRLLAYEARAAGLSFELSHAGFLPGEERLRLDMIAQVADKLIFNFYLARDGTFAPWWWMEAGLANALVHKVPAWRIELGLGNFGQYWPVTGQSAWQEVTYSQIVDLMVKHNAFSQWIESSESGLIRLRYADIGEGHIWFTDSDVVRSRLELVKQFRLGGVALFRPSTGDLKIWDILRDWKSEEVPPASKPTDFFTMGQAGK